MKNLLILLMVLFSFAACSSDDPVIDDGGGNGKIPNNALEGYWDFVRYYYDVKVSGNTEIEDAIKKGFDTGSNSNNFPKGGYIYFLPGRQSLAPYLDFTEGSVGRSLTINSPSGNSYLGDYFTKGDTIFYYPYDNTAMRYMLKKGKQIQYIYDRTEHYQTNVYPGKGVEKVVYYVEYVRKK